MRQILVLPLFAAIGLLAISNSARAATGDKILRGGLSYVSPTSVSRIAETGFEDFLDPNRPPTGRFDITSDHRIGAGANFGFGIGFEYMLTDIIGIDTNFNYSRQPVDATFAGQTTFTPYLGQPPTLVPELNETAPIIGAGAGEADMYLLTFGTNFHVLRREKLDLYMGPVVGLAHVAAKFNSGSFSMEFNSFTSVTPLATGSFSQDISNDFTLGAAVGIDVPLGHRRWLVSSTAKYIPVENLDPWMIQVNLGHRF